MLGLRGLGFRWQSCRGALTKSGELRLALTMTLITGLMLGFSTVASAAGVGRVWVRALGTSFQRRRVRGGAVGADQTSRDIRRNVSDRRPDHFGSIMFASFFSYSRAVSCFVHFEKPGLPNL